jgi:hypothetical protein
MIEIAGTTYYMVFGLYLPCFVACVFLAVCLFLLLLINRFFMQGRVSFVKTLSISLVLALVGTIYLFRDVYFIGQQAKKLCAAEGGMRIYRTAKVDTKILRTVNPDLEEVRSLLQRGYAAIEGPIYDHTDPEQKKKFSRGTLQKYRFTLKDGVIVRQPINKYSREAMRYGTPLNTTIVNRAIEKNTYFIKDIYTNEVLSEATFFSIFPGIFESKVVGISGFTFTPWFCGDVDRQDLVERTLISKGGRIKTESR